MAITLVINNSRDLENAITKGFVFCGLTLLLMLSALCCVIFLAIKKSEGLEEVGPFLLVTAPFVLHSVQLLTTLIILHIARTNPENITMTKCRWWSVISRVLTAPILIEMMILIGFKWYLTVVAIPLVIMYFVTILQVEKIMHYFFTRNLSSRIPNRGGMSHHRELLFFEYPYDIDVNSSFYRLSASNNSPRNRPPSQSTIVNAGNSLALALSFSLPIRNSPPPSYRDAMNLNFPTTTSVGRSSGTTNCFRIPLVLRSSPSDDSSSVESPPPAYESLKQQESNEDLRLLETNNSSSTTTTTTEGNDSANIEQEKSSSSSSKDDKTANS